MVPELTSDGTDAPDDGEQLPAAWVIDTPGVRAFGLAHVQVGGPLGEGGETAQPGGHPLDDVVGDHREAVQTTALAHGVQDVVGALRVVVVQGLTQVLAQGVPGGPGPRLSRAEA